MARRVAVILAGGVGTRVGLSIPKQLIKVAGRTILEHTLATIHSHPKVDEVLIMMTPGHLDAVREIVRDGDYHKVSSILEGGETRNDTTLNALAAIPDDDAQVLFHDAVRPLLSHRIITDCFVALNRFDAVDVAIPSADTIIEVGADNTIADIPPRAQLRRGQTPQAFRAGALRRAYQAAAQDPNFQATDDCTVVLRYTPEVPIWVVEGDESNMKVTEPIDIYLADKLFQLSTTQLPPSRTEAQYREALTGKVMVILGGSYGIGADIAEFARNHGATVYTFSRSSTNTHIERREDLRAAIQTVLEESPTIDFVVNTAAILPRGSLVDTTEETLYAATAVNYMAPVMIAQEFYPFLAASHGSLLNFTSSSYTRGRGGYSLYSSAKAAVVNLTQALADEWSADQIRVNCINPERTGTPMRTKAFGEEPPESLLESAVVAQRSIDVLLSSATGLVIDIRRDDPLNDEE